MFASLRVCLLASLFACLLVGLLLCFLWHASLLACLFARLLACWFASTRPEHPWPESKEALIEWTRFGDFLRRHCQHQHFGPFRAPPNITVSHVFTSSESALLEGLCPEIPTFPGQCIDCICGVRKDAQGRPLGHPHAGLMLRVSCRAEDCSTSTGAVCA